MKFRFSIDVKSVLKTNWDINAPLKCNSVFIALSPTLTLNTDKIYKKEIKYVRKNSNLNHKIQLRLTETLACYLTFQKTLKARKNKIIWTKKNSKKSPFKNQPKSLK
jgi:hypothetical protein